MKIVWDEPKRLWTLAARDLDFADLTMEFFVGSVIAGASKGRFKAVGFLGDRFITVIFRPLGSEAVSVISMRRASRVERSIYEQSASPHSRTH